MAYCCSFCCKGFATKQTRSRHENTCLEREKSNKGNRGNEEEYLPSSEEEDTSFNSLFTGGSGGSSEFCKKLDEVGAAHGMFLL